MKMPQLPTHKKPDMTPEFKNKLLDNMWEQGLVPKELNSLYRHTDSFTGYSIESIEERMALTKFRDQYIRKFGFVLLNEELLSALTEVIGSKSVVEVGAGSGWLSYNLQQQGVNITPIDIEVADKNQYGFQKTFTEIIEQSGQDYFKKNNPEVVVLSWPNYDQDYGYDILNALQPGQTFIYMGEHEGGCCANDKFFDLLAEKCELMENDTNKLQAESLRWMTIHDDIWVYRVK